jgi:hypothetical protein
MEADAIALREAGLALQAQVAKRKFEDDDEALIICIASAALAVAAAVLGQEEEDNQPPKNGPYKKRAPRRVFDVCWGAHHCINRDYLGQNSLFEKEFHKSFRLSRSRVELIIQDLGQSGDPFFQTFRRDKFGRVLGPSLEPKVLLPLISIA